MTSSAPDQMCVNATDKQLHADNTIISFAAALIHTGGVSNDNEKQLNGTPCDLAANPSPLWVHTDIKWPRDNSVIPTGLELNPNPS